MSDIPETFMQAAWECEFPHSGQTRREAIARALMAAAREADEAATKRERERAANIILHNSISYGVETVLRPRRPDDQHALEYAAAILKGEA